MLLTRYIYRIERWDVYAFIPFRSKEQRVRGQEPKAQAIEGWTKGKEMEIWEEGAGKDRPRQKWNSESAYLRQLTRTRECVCDRVDNNGWGPKESTHEILSLA